jgi:hypothetical protein
MKRSAKYIRTAAAVTMALLTVISTRLAYADTTRFVFTNSTGVPTYDLHVIFSDTVAGATIISEPAGANGSASSVGDEVSIVWLNAIPPWATVAFDVTSATDIGFALGSWTGPDGRPIPSHGEVIYPALHFNGPQITGGPGVVIGTTDPAGVALERGFELTGLDYSIVSTEANAPIAASWSATRQIEVGEDEASHLPVTIFGQTTLSMTGEGEVTFFVDGTWGTHDTKLGPQFSFTLVGPFIDEPLPWNETAFVDDNPFFVSDLGIQSGIIWTPTSAGEVLAVSSLYGVRARGVDEPNGVLLVVLGIALLRLVRTGAFRSLMDR